MTALRVIVVDDEALARQRLARFLANAGCEVLAEYTGIPELLEGLKTLPRPDALFLDIEMPGGKGLEALPELDRSLPVVFVTAYAEHAVRAYDADVVDYILKPVFEERLERALERIRQRRAPGATPEPRPQAQAEAPKSTVYGPRFPAKAGSGHVFLELKRVSHFELDDEAVWVWSGGKRFRAPWNTLAEVEQNYPKENLLRIQRHLLLRPEAILGHRPLPDGRACVRVAEGQELVVSRGMSPRLRAQLGLTRL